MSRTLILSFLSAVLYVLAFPHFDQSALAWIALVPLAYAVHSQNPKRACLSGRQAFWIGWLTGTLANAGLLYWILVTFNAAQQSVFLSIPCWLMLSMYLGLYWGGWTWGISRAPAGWAKPLVAAAGWVALEYLRTHLFSGFPWALLGDSQWRHTRLIQIVSLTSVYGISFLVVLINMTLASIAVSSLKANKKQVLLAAVVFLAVLVYGASRLHSHAMEPVAPGHTVALLQGSIDQYQKWDPRYIAEIERVYERLNTQAAEGKPTLIVWPETSVPGYLLQDPPLRTWLSGVITRSGTSHIVGAPSMDNADRAYNTAFSLNAKAVILGQYDKQHLVPFGEVVPFSSFLGRWIHVLNELGGFTAGRRSPVVPSSIGPIGINICYEAIFPNLVRQAVRQGAGVIVNLTNDGWYMRTSAPYQHFVPNVFRAVENHRAVIRADNTGITAIVEPTGRLQAASRIFQPAVITGTVVPRQDLTFYTRFGDVFAWACLLLCIVVSARAILRRP